MVAGDFHRRSNTSCNRGMDQEMKATMESGFGALLDIQDSIIACICMMRHSKIPTGVHFGFETASTVSSREFINFLWCKEK
jgi:hypothetical protein